MRIYTLLLLPVLLLAKAIPEGYITPVPPDVLLKPEVRTHFGSLRFDDGIADEQSAKSIEEEYNYLTLSNIYFHNKKAVWLEILKNEFQRLGIRDNIDIAITNTAITSRVAWPELDPQSIYAVALLQNDQNALLLQTPTSFRQGVVLDRWGNTLVKLQPSATYYIPSAQQATLYSELQNDQSILVHLGEFDKEVRLIKSPTRVNYLFFQIDRNEGAELFKEELRLYAPENNESKPNEFVNISYKNSVVLLPKSARFFKLLDDIVQDDAVTHERQKELLRAGILKGRPFMPDTQTRKELHEAALSAGIITAYEHLLEELPTTDPTLQLHLIDKGTKAVRIEYDTNNETFDGAKSYRLHLQHVPAASWSITLYDTQTGAMLQNSKDLTPYKRSTEHGLVRNEDGSVDIYFSPEIDDTDLLPNTIKTVPSKRWYAIFRLYAPSEAFYQTQPVLKIEPFNPSSIKKSEEIPFF